MRTTPCTLLSAVLLAATGAAQNLLANPDFEQGLAGWTFFGNASAEIINPPQTVPRSGAQLCKLFGNFSGAFNVSGVFQSFPASPGQTFTLDCWSRHWDGDRLTGAGMPNDNWATMKIAFWDSSNVEIGSAESVILDGTSPRDTWINNAPVAATAPGGTVRVEALILFLQPGAAGGSAQIDDAVFTGPPTTPAYPGTGEDLALSSALAGGPLSSGPGNDIKLVPATGSVLELNISSPNGGFALQPYLVLAQLFTTGRPPVPSPIFPELWFNFVGGPPLLVLITGMPSPVGPSVIGPNRGTSSFYQIPPGLSGSSLMVQALVVMPSTANNFYAASDALELRFQ